jgi:hypothetical protein
MHLINLTSKGKKKKKKKEISPVTTFNVSDLSMHFENPSSSKIINIVLLFAKKTKHSNLFHKFKLGFS